MPDVPGGFDWVACLDVFWSTCRTPAAVLAELYALMAPGGRMVVTVPNWYDIINAKILGRNKFHLHAHTPWGWMAILKKAGFTVESCRAVSFPVIKSDFLAAVLPWHVHNDKGQEVLNGACKTMSAARRFK